MAGAAGAAAGAAGGRGGRVGEGYRGRSDRRGRGGCAVRRHREGVLCISRWPGGGRGRRPDIVSALHGLLR